MRAQTCIRGCMLGERLVREWLAQNASVGWGRCQWRWRGDRHQRSPCCNVVGIPSGRLNGGWRVNCGMGAREGRGFGGGSEAGRVYSHERSLCAAATSSFTGQRVYTAAQMQAGAHLALPGPLHIIACICRVCLRSASLAWFAIVWAGMYNARALMEVCRKFVQGRERPEVVSSSIAVPPQT